MALRLTLDQYLVRVAVPMIGVFGSVVLLGLAAIGLVADIGSEMQRQTLFAAGVLSWMFGIGWGTIVNTEPIIEKTG